ncbi:MAG: HEAT repeat domain-containing protein [Bryobacteraceae bacterium]
MESARLYSLIAQLDSDQEEERRNAVHQLGAASAKDRRAVPHLIRVLLNHDESPSVRGDAAELLSLSGSRKAIKPLVECSNDASAEVRFWCTFALGHFVRRRKRRRKVVMPVARALEDRLGDKECPDDRGNWWPVGLEALAMLQGCELSRLPVEPIFKETIISAVRDPLSHRDKWRWADCYWVDSMADSPTKGRALYERALQKIRDAGFEPVKFGQDPR